MRPVGLKKEVEVELSAAELAKVFCQMDACAQADFFVAVGEEAKKWGDSPQYQWHSIGRRLQHVGLELGAGVVEEIHTAMTERKG